MKRETPKSSGFVSIPVEMKRSFLGGLDFFCVLGVAVDEANSVTFNLSVLGDLP